jgi:hypothetical protein
LVLIPRGETRLDCGAAFKERERKENSKKNTPVGANNLLIRNIVQHILALI